MSNPGGPHPDAAGLVDSADAHPLVAAVRRFVVDELAPRALQNDNTEVPEHLIPSLRALGALNHLAPATFGGADLDRAADRRLHEHLAYGCVNTWLIWAQHAPIVGRIKTQLAVGRDIGVLAQRVLRGEFVAGAGLSDVRRYPRGHLTAVPTADGWVFRGTVSWVSGWGLNQVLLLAAVEEETAHVVTALVPVSGQTAATPLTLTAVAGSRTMRVRIDEVAVPAGDVLTVGPLSAWQAADRAETSDARPHIFGLSARVLDELRAETGAAEVVERWAPRVAEIRRRAYTLAEQARSTGQPGLGVDARLATKAEAAEALMSLSQALLVARAGRGIAADNTAQLHARSALFLLVQGQTGSVREAQLGRIAARC